MRDPAPANVTSKDGEIRYTSARGDEGSVQIACSDEGVIIDWFDESGVGVATWCHDFDELLRFVEQFTPLLDFKRRYMEWAEERKDLSAREENGKVDPLSDEWPNSDDDGIELLLSIACAIGWDEADG